MNFNIVVNITSNLTLWYFSRFRVHISYIRDGWKWTEAYNLSVKLRDLFKQNARYIRFLWYLLIYGMVWEVPPTEWNVAWISLNTFKSKTTSLGHNQITILRVFLSYVNVIIYDLAGRNNVRGLCDQGWPNHFLSDL
jgi:hypothetical protein